VFKSPRFGTGFLFANIALRLKTAANTSKKVSSLKSLGYGISSLNGKVESYRFLLIGSDRVSYAS
jgi:hypothetical protein